MDDHTKENNQESISSLRKEIINRLFYIIIAFIVLCLVCLAWFANNTKVSSEGSQVEATDVRFELATQGTTSRYDNSDDVEGNEVTINDQLYYLTSGSKNFTTWMTSTDSHFQNVALEDNAVTSSSDLLHPGTSGKITFYVVPQVDDLHSMHFTLSYVPYSEVSNTEGLDDVRTMNKTINQSNGTTTQEIFLAPNSDKIINDLLKGHILFFRDYSNAIYSNYIDLENGLTIEWNSAPIKGEPQKITLYWVWPMLFSNFRANGLMDDTVQKTMINAMNAKKSYFFYKNGDDEFTSLPTVSGTMTNQELNGCASYYNSADEYLGTNVRLLMFQLIAEEINE